ncbi:hypothetical protein BC835DRAFT_883378 [Cytidiella melzeri]|nr:hypothetical protein BC835DRAFT_883378 [Cytidiella melzeri]
MPALYAESVRDYDDGIGLLVIGNVMGELALYSLSGTDFSTTEHCLEPGRFFPWDGKELLPTSPVPSYPLRIASLHGGIISDADKQSNLEFWQDHFSDNVPEGWSTTDWFSDRPESLGEAFVEDIGAFQWPLEHACHFLGRPIPLMHQPKGRRLVVFKVGGLFLIFDPYYDCGDGSAVISPQLGLDDIIARLPRQTELLDSMEDVTPQYAVFEESVAYGLRRFWPYYTWERCELETRGSGKHSEITSTRYIKRLQRRDERNEVHRR